jgi:bleomycin hydrolase
VIYKILYVFILMDINKIKIIEKQISKNSKLQLLSNILQQNNISKLVEDQSQLNNVSNQTFNVELPVYSTPNQYDSGRCWIFSAVNMLRHKLIQTYKLDTKFELSESYITKYDKIEKCMTALEQIYQFAKADIDINNIAVYTRIKNTLGDGGNWCMFQNIITKYGIMPKNLFADTYQATHTHYMNAILKALINKAKTRIFDKKCKTKLDFIKIRDETMIDCVKVISMCIGVSPTDTFKWRDPKTDKDIDYTPLAFYKKFVFPANKIVNLFHAPSHPYFTILKEKHSNMYDITTKYYNLPSDIIEQAAYKCLTKYKIPVFFCCKVDSLFFLKNKSVLDIKSSSVEELFEIDLSESKKDALLNNNRKANHAMTIIGCDYDRKKKEVVKWKVQNSWGEYNDAKGIITMSRDFFNMYIADICVPIACLSPGYLTKFKKEVFVDVATVLHHN